MKIVSIILGLLLVCLLASWLSWRRLAILSKKRLQSGYTMSSWEHPWANDVISYIRREMGKPDFPVMPTDSLGKVYGIGDEDLDDAVVSLSSGVSMETRQAALEGLPPVKTVEDLANALAKIASLHEAAGG
jgi:hypothetical protein